MKGSRMRVNRLVYLFTLLSIAVLYFFENNTGTRILLYAAVVIPAVSILFSTLNLRYIQAALDLPERRKKTEKILGFVLTGQALPGVRIYGNVTVVHSFSDIRRMRISCHGRNGMGAFDLEAHCGAIEVTLDSIECGDLFGLFLFSRAVQAKKICIIEPPLFPVDPDVLQMEELFVGDGEPESQTKGPDSFEPDGIREYQPGDRIQSIHWKLSSKTDLLLVRESDTLNERTPLLVLDSRCMDEEIRDALLSAMLSFSKELYSGAVPHAMGVRGKEMMESDSFDEARDRLLLGELCRDEGQLSREYASVFLFTDEAEDLPDPDWERLRIQRICVRKENAGADDLVLDLSEMSGGRSVLRGNKG